MMRNAVWGVLAAVSIAGCATVPVDYPRHTITTVTVSTALPDSDFDLGDHRIPNSHVLIGGRTSGSSVGSAFGLLGLAIGSSIDQARNYSALEGTQQVLGTKFDAIVTEALRRGMIAPLPSRTDVQLLPPNAPDAIISLMPIARLSLGNHPGAALMVRLHAYFGEPDKQGRRSSVRAYVHSQFAPRPVVGGDGSWAGEGGAAFRATARRALDRLAAAFLSDVRGELPRGGENLRSVQWRVEPSRNASALVLQEHPDYLVLIPVLDGKPFRHNTIIVERSQLVE